MGARRGLRSIDRQTGVDRKTVRRYVEAAVAAGLVANGDESQLSDGLVGLVCVAVRPAGPAAMGGVGGARAPCRACEGLREGRT